MSQIETYTQFRIYTKLHLHIFKLWKEGGSGINFADPPWHLFKQTQFHLSLSTPMYSPNIILIASNLSQALNQPVNLYLGRFREWGR